MSRTTRNHQPHYYWLNKPHKDKLSVYVEAQIKRAMTSDLRRVAYGHDPQPYDELVKEETEYATKIWLRMHRDYDWNGGLKRTVKHASKNKVRVAARAENYKLMNDPEYDNRPHEWETRGEIWNWD